MKTGDYNERPRCYPYELAAREEAAQLFPNLRLSIIHSPHKSNTGGDWFIDAPGGMLRSWEQEVFCGLGRDARKAKP